MSMIQEIIKKHFICSHLYEGEDRYIYRDKELISGYLSQMDRGYK